MDSNCLAQFAWPRQMDLLLWQDNLCGLQQVI
jgi:hypothetical protein